MRIVFFDTALFSATRVASSNYVLRPNVGFTKSRNIAIGIATVLFSLMKPNSRIACFQLRYAGSVRMLFVCVIPAEYINDALYNSITHACQGRYNRRLVWDGLIMPANMFAMSDGIAAHTVHENLLLLSSLIPFPKEPDGVFRHLSFLWGATIDMDVIVRDSFELTRYPNMMVLFNALYNARIKHRVVEGQTHAHMYFLRRRHWLPHWIFLQKHLATTHQMQTHAIPVTDITLSVLLMYWRFNIKVQIRGGEQFVSFATQMETLFSSMQGSTDVIADVRAQWIAQAPGIPDELIRLARIDIDDSPFAIDATASRLADLFQQFPAIAWLVDVQKIKKMVHAIESCCFTTNKTNSTLLYAYMLYSQVPHTLLSENIKSIYRMLMWGQNQILSETHIMVIIKRGSKMRDSLMSLLHSVPHQYSQDTQMLSVPVSVFCNPHTSIVPSASMYKRLINFVYLYTQHLSAPMPLQSGISIDMDFLVVPITIMFHDDTLPGGTASVMFMDLPADWIRTGLISYYVHTPPTECQQPTSEQHPDTVQTSDICICNVCSMRLVKTEKYAIAIKRNVLCGNVIFTQALFACSLDNITQYVSDTGNAKINSRLQLLCS